MKRRVGIASVALVVAFVLAGSGCGDDRSDMSAAGATALGKQADAARAAIVAGDATRGRALLDALDRTLADLVAGDDISAARANDVRAAVADVRAGIAAWVAATTTTTTTTPPTTAANRDQGEHPDRGRGGDKKDDD